MATNGLKPMRPSPLMPNRIGSVTNTSAHGIKPATAAHPVYVNNSTAYPVQSNSQPHTSVSNTQGIKYSPAILQPLHPQQAHSGNFGPTTTPSIPRSIQHDPPTGRYDVPPHSHVGAPGTTSGSLALNSSVVRSQNINHSIAESHAKKAATNTPIRASPLMSKVASSAIEPPDRHTPNVTSSFAGKIVPAERPYAFTTVTYAKTNPVGTQKAMLNESYARQYASTGPVGTRAAGGSSSCSTSTVSRARHRVQQRNPGGMGRRFAKREGGVCGSFNEKVCCGVFDSTGGCCGCLNCGGCCDRPQNIPMDIQYAPQPY